MLLKNWLSRNKTTLRKTSGSWAGGFLPVVLSTCFFISGHAQVNLVQNPGFEDISSCPTSANQIKLAQGWDTLKNGGGGGAEVFSVCANPNTNVGVPTNLFGLSYQKPKSGNTYSSMTWFMPSTNYQREYIQNKLLRPLEVGKTYCVTYYVSLTSRSQYAIEGLGAYFDKGAISTPPFMPFITNPHIESPSGFYYSDTLNWEKVQDSFVAIDTYSYLTIGLFRSNSNANFITAYPNNPASLAEYYIDDVSVIEVNTPAYAGPDTTICRTDSAYIGRPNEIGLECEWFANQQPIGSGTGIWVKPDNTTSYVVKQDICGHISYDTVTVFVKDEDCYTTDFEVPNVFSPNEDGVNDAWHFEVKKGSDIRYTIYNRWGNLMKTSAVSGQTVVTWDGRTTAGEACPAGTYYYVLNYTNGKGEAQKKNGYITLIK